MKKSPKHFKRENSNERLTKFNMEKAAEGEATTITYEEVRRRPDRGIHKPMGVTQTNG